MKYFIFILGLFISSFGSIASGVELKTPPGFYIVTPPPMIFNQSILYAPSSEFISLVNLNSGKKKWSHKLRSTVFGFPAFGNEQIFYGDQDGILHSLSEKTGKEKWNFQTSSPIISTPVFHKDKIYLSSSSGYFFILDTKAGKVISKMRIGDEDLSAPVIGNNKIFLLNRSGTFYSINLDGKSGLWRTQTKEEIYPYEIGSHGMSAFSFLFHITLPTPSYQDDLLSFKSSKHDYTIDANTGKILKKESISPSVIKTKEFHISNAQDVFYHVSNHQLIASLEGSNKILWEKRIAKDFNPAQTITNRTLFYSDGPKLYAIDFKTGEALWKH